MFRVTEATVRRALDSGRSAGELHEARLYRLPRAHRAVGDREWQEYLAAEAAGRN